jgi:hypothetical protein
MDTAEFVNKFYTECQHKHEVINPYTGDIILVPCGVCDACKVSKSVLAENHYQTGNRKYFQYPFL